MESFENVEILYLDKGSSWYDAATLLELDFLITFLDNYDLTKALKLMSSARSNKIVSYRHHRA
jgi:hypothetical protein